MNKCWYSCGNPFKVKFRDHRCCKCDEKLTLVQHHKIVDPASEEAKYYDFNLLDSAVKGPCEFIHKIFHCKMCGENTEIKTQINQEDIDIIIKNVEKHFRTKGRNLTIKKYFETKDNELKEYSPMEQVKHLCLLINENGKTTLHFKVPVSRSEFWERPWYFTVNKKELINFISQH